MRDRPAAGERTGGAPLKTRLAAVLVAWSAAAAAAWGAASEYAAEYERRLEEQVRARGLDPEEVVFPARLTDEMRAWAAEQVRPTATSSERLDQLLDALIAHKGLRLEYEDGYTATAAEAFESRRANCLAFTQLFVSMARELGLDTYYVNVERVERFRREGDLVVVSGHVTAGWTGGAERKILEFGAVADTELRQVRRISDLNALARYHANRGAERLRDGEIEEARRWARLAVRLDPRLADGWVNLGVALRRLGELDEAERAYLEAIAVDADHLPAYHNLSLLLRLRGRTDAAQAILRLLDRRDNRNPFIYLDLGDASLRDGRLDEARRFYKRALRLGPDLAETRAAQGLLELERGRPAKARVWLRRAAAIDAEESRVVELADRLQDDEES